MPLDHYTLRDNSATHQVRLFMVRQQVCISCNCRATVGQHEKAGKLYYESMGVTLNIQQSRDIYNNPDNHNAPFGEEDVAKW